MCTSYPASLDGRLNLRPHPAAILHILPKNDLAVITHRRQRILVVLGIASLAAFVAMLSLQEPAKEFHVPLDASCSDAMALSENNGLCATLSDDDATLKVLVPTVMILGGQKCATTSLAFQMQDTFPELRSCGHVSERTGNSIPERHFFDENKLFDSPKKVLNCVKYWSGCHMNTPVSPSWLFGNSCTQPAVPSSSIKASVGFDRTPNYFPDYYAAERMKALYGRHGEQLRFIVVFRDPSDRVRSYFTHFQPVLNINSWVRFGLAKVKQVGGCDNVLLPDESLYGKGAAIAICASTYVVHLQRWMDVFQANQFLSIPFTKYLDQPGKVLAAVGAHTGLASKHRQQQIIDEVKDPYHENTRATKLANAAKGFNDKMAADVKADLDKFFAPYNDKLLELVASSGMKAAVSRIGKPLLF
jgi:hypothetical protein